MDQFRVFVLVMIALCIITWVVPLIKKGWKKWEEVLVVHFRCLKRWIKSGLVVHFQRLKRWIKSGTNS